MSWDGIPPNPLDAEGWHVLSYDGVEEEQYWSVFDNAADLMPDAPGLWYDSEDFGDNWTYPRKMVDHVYVRAGRLT